MKCDYDPKEMENQDHKCVSCNVNIIPNNYLYCSIFCADSNELEMIKPPECML